MEFQRQLTKNRDHEFVAFERSHLDITSEEALSEAFSRYKPDVLLNCAAYNHVDRAESAFAEALAVNATGPEILAKYCRQYGCFLVHFSSDYVFAGTKGDLYTENDLTHPINKYGESKLRGEEAVRTGTSDFLIFRTSWVFGPGQQNFLFKLRQWSETQPTLQIVCDQFSTPTSAEDIARTALLALKRELRGVFHLTNGGYASRYEVAQFFLKTLGKHNVILPTLSSSFATEAKRPFLSALSHDSLINTLGTTIPHWTDAVARFAKQISV